MPINRKEIKLYKAKTILDVTEKDSLYCLKADNETEFRIVVTDVFGNPVNLKDLTGGSTNIVSGDNTITVTGVSTKDIRISTTLYNLINSALQAGDNISSLTNDSNFITLGDIPSFNPLDYDLTDFTNTDVDPFARLSDIVVGSGIQSVVAGTNISVDNTDPLNPIVSSPKQTLSETLLEGDITDGKNINISDGDAIILDNGSKLVKGTTDAGLGGAKGIARICSVGYEEKWEAGRQYIMETDGFTIRESLHNFSITPTITDDFSKGYVVGSRWTLDDGSSYECLDSTVGAAVWALSGASGITNLGYIASPTDGTITSDTGSDATIPLADNTNAGLLTPSEKSDIASAVQPGDLATVATSGDYNDLINTPTEGFILHTIASGVDTYTATVTGVTSYSDGDAYLVRFTNGNTTNCTLNINSLGAKVLYRNNDGVLIGGDIVDGGEMLCVYNTTLSGFQCIGTAPNTLLAYVTNADSVAITKGQPVYAFSGTGDRMSVKRAFNTSDATSAQTVGLVLSASITAGQKGLIIMQGLLDGLSILPTSTFSDGDPIYLGATAGTLTNVKPYAPNHLVYLGVVTTASNGSAGRMYVRVQNGYELDELHNVQAQSPSLKDVLWYDNTVSPAQWKTASISTILGYTPENVANKTDVMSGNTTSSTKYLSTKGAYDWVIGLGYLLSSIASSTYQTLANIVTSFSLIPSDSKYPSEKLVKDSLDAKITANSSITGATKTKITYDSKGLVTSGTDATTADIAASTNKNYVTDAQLVVIGNTSGINTGDQDLSGLMVKANNGSDINNIATFRANLGVDKLTQNGNSNYSILSTDKVVVTSATLTAPRTWTLPAANSVNAGYEIIVADLFGGVSSTNTLIIARAGSDTINGATSQTIGAQYGMRRFFSDGVSKWTFDGGVMRISDYIGTTLTPSKAVVTDSNSKLAPSTTTATEIGYVSGVTSSIQPQIDALNINVITISTAVSITTDTTSGGYGQHGRHNKISNGANAINLTVQTTSNADFVASYEKIGSSTITFVAGSGASLVQLSGTAALSGAVGSKACLSRNGNTYYLQITNY